MSKNNELPVFTKWIEFLKWLFPITAKFPHKARFTFSNRIDNIALDIVENLIEARYTKNRNEILRHTNLKIEKIRVLLRLSNYSKFISYNSYEYAIRKINEVGKMIGGWIKHGEIK